MIPCNIKDSLATLEPTNAGMFKVGLAIFGKLCEINQQYDDMASCDINEAIARAGCCPDVGPFGMLKAIYGKLCAVEDAIDGNAPVDCCECFRAEEGPPLWTPALTCDLALHQNLLTGTFSYYDDRVGETKWVDLIV